MPDISVIVTAHGEGVIMGATLRSVESAIAAAQLAGYSCERLIGLDAPTDATRAMAEQPDLTSWQVHTFEFRDPFLTRNAMTERASGKWVAFVDGDDLVSENWLALAAARLAAEEDELTVAHPELNVIFDGETGAFKKVAQSDHLFLPEVFYFENYYDLMAMAPRTLYRKRPFSRREIECGFGFQDWQWNLETMAAGANHLVVRDTIVFKRRRTHSVSQENRARSAVVKSVPSALRIDRIRQLCRRT